MKTKEKILKEIFDNDPMGILDKPFTTNEKLYNMNKLIQQIADKCIEEIDEHINNTIHWQFEFDNEIILGSNFFVLENLIPLLKSQRK